MKVFNVICLTLVIVGAIVWGIIGIFNFNLVDALFGTGSAFSRIIYTLVGIAGLYLISFYGLICNEDQPNTQKIPLMVVCPLHMLVLPLTMTCCVFCMLHMSYFSGRTSIQRGIYDPQWEIFSAIDISTMINSRMFFIVKTSTPETG